MPDTAAEADIRKNTTKEDLVLKATGCSSVLTYGNKLAGLSDGA